jgi:hypothetical protein
MNLLTLDEARACVYAHIFPFLCIYVYHTRNRFESNRITSNRFLCFILEVERAHRLRLDTYVAQQTHRERMVRNM